MPTGWVQSAFVSGALVLIDGVDELPAHARGQFFEWIDDLITTFPDSVFIVSSRPAALEARQPVHLASLLAAAGFAGVTLEPMTLSDSEALVTRWHNAVARDLLDEESRASLAAYERTLRVALRERPAVRNIASNPLLCAMICALNWDRQELLPNNRMELYRLALEMLLGRRDEARRIGPTLTDSLDRETKETILDGLAYWMLRNRLTEADQPDVESVIAGILSRLPHVQESPGTVLQELLVRSGVLRMPQHGRVDFVHRTFLEYMGARAAVASRDMGLLSDHAREESWREVVVFAAGHANGKDRDDLMERLLRPSLLRRQSAEQKVTAVCCLESVGRNLAPHLQKQIGKLAASLFPPANLDMARLLAPAAAINPKWLTGHAKRGDAVVAACIRTATAVGTQNMLDIIEQYIDVDGDEIDQQLVQAWPLFDAGLFERRIIDRRAKLFGVDIRSFAPESLKALKIHLLSGSSRSQSISFLLPRQIAAFETVGAIFLDSSQDLAVDPLHDASGMVFQGSVDLRFVPEVTPAIIERLTELTKLRRLAVGKVNRDALRRLTAMRELEFLQFAIDEEWNPGLLGVLENLRALRLGGAGVKSIQNLGRFRELAALSLTNSNVADMRPLMDLPKLRWLQLGVANEAYANIPELPALRRLDVESDRYASGDDVRIPYDYLRGLEMLTLSHARAGSLVGWNDAKRLEVLQLYEPSIDRLMPAVQFPHTLKHVFIEGPYDKSLNVDLTDIDSLGDLESLTLAWCTVAEARSLLNLPSLRSVNLRSCLGDLESLPALLKERNIGVTSVSSGDGVLKRVGRMLWG